MTNEVLQYPDDPRELNSTAESEDFAHLLDDPTLSHYGPPAEGELLHGHVLSVMDRFVIVDFGYKSEGLIPIEECQDAEGSLRVKSGDPIDVMVDRQAEPVEGYVMLSHRKAARLKIWDDLEAAAREGTAIQGVVTGVTKGGLEVDIGVSAFLPGSHVDIRPAHQLEQFVGQQVEVQIVKLNRRRGNVVVSRKALLEAQISALKAQTLASIQEGSIVTGEVKNLTEYGAFIDLGGIDGLLHVSDMSHGRVRHPSELVQVGDTVTVKVLKFDPEKERISLGMKQAIPDPWSDASHRYVPGTRVIGRVVSVTDYGAFVELETGVEGLIHISEMTWSRRMKHPSKVMKVGDQVEAVVLEVKADQHRVSLGIKQLEPDPWTTLDQRYSVGSVVEGRVRKLADFGAFIEIEEGVDGLVHISDLSWTKRIKHPSELLKKGQIAQAVILGIDPGNRRLSLGVKQLQPDAWENFFHSHMPGDVVRGRVLRGASFGVFVEVAPGVEGLCHNSEVPGYQSRAKDEPALAIGAEMDFKIVKMVESEKKIGLSVRAIAEDEERTRLADYQRQAAAATMTLEEVIQIKGPGEDN
jgi:small subunit ribosomal protein S1